MKKLTSIIIFLIFSTNLYSQVDSTIYGLTRTPNAFYFSKINPVTGVVTNISTSIVSNSIANNTSTINPIKKQFYFRDLNKFYTVDLITGNVINSPNLTYTYDASFDFFIYNCMDSTIYGLSSNYYAHYFSKIDPITGIVTRISNIPVSISVCNFSSTINPFTKQFYFRNLNQFITVDITTGNVISNPNFLVQNGTDFDMFVFNFQDSTIYGLTRSPTSFYFSKIDPTTGVVSNISNNSIASTINSTASTIDPFKKQFYFETPNQFISVDITTGNIVNNPNFSISSGTDFNIFRFNHNFCSCNFPINVDLGGDKTICDNNEIVLDPKITNATYLWQDNSTNATYTVKQKGTYWVKVTDNNNCSVYDTIHVYYNDCDTLKIIIPNIFTPNGDGYNDYFVIKNADYKKIEVQIYNRWGELVFQDKNYQNNWDGRYKGNPSADGTYFYTIKSKGIFNNKEDYYNGSLTILR